MGSETTWDTAESTSQVNSLIPTHQNPETLALAVHNPEKTTPTSPARSVCMFTVI